MGSGFQVVEIDERYILQLSKAVPDFPPGLFQWAVSSFLSDDDTPTPRSVRDELDELANGAIDLSARLNRLSLEASEAITLREFGLGVPSLSDRLADDLMSLMGIAEMARRDVEGKVSRGAKFSKNTLLVSDLALALRQAGLEVDARPSGPLVLSFGIALDVAGKTVANPSKTVASALETLGKE